MRPLGLISSLALFWLLLAPVQANAHESAHEDLPQNADTALSCGNATAFAPDVARGEGTILLIIENRSDYQIRIRGPKIFQASEPLSSRHCLKRFIHPGEHRFTLTAYRLNTYPWLKPLKEWFAVGETRIGAVVPDNTAAVLDLTIDNDAIHSYNFERYLRENLFNFFSIGAIYLLTLLPIAALALTITALKNRKKETRQ